MIDFQSIPSLEPLYIIIGAGLQRWPGWNPPQKEELDLLKPKEWAVIFRCPTGGRVCVNMCGSI